MEVSRRDFLKLSGFSAGAIALLGGSTLLAGCEEFIEELIEKIRNRPVRVDANGPNGAAALEKYAAVVQAMKALPEANPHSWRSMERIHEDSCAHRNWLFLPWHRAYLFNFEQIGRKLIGDETFAVPYWNWTANPQLPAAFFNQSSPLYNSTRAVNAQSAADSFYVGTNRINGILNETNFIAFAGDPAEADQTEWVVMGPLESSPHNYIHGTFIQGDMAQFHSPRDPIFWLHHARIDQLWVEWNITRGHPNTADTAWTGRDMTGFTDRDGNQNVDVSVNLTLLYPLLSYRYDTQAAL